MAPKLYPNNDHTSVSDFNLVAIPSNTLTMITTNYSNEEPTNVLNLHPLAISLY